MDPNYSQLITPQHTHTHINQKLQGRWRKPHLTLFLSPSYNSNTHGSSGKPSSLRPRRHIEEPTPDAALIHFPSTNPAAVTSSILHRDNIYILALCTVGPFSSLFSWHTFYFLANIYFDDVLAYGSQKWGGNPKLVQSSLFGEQHETQLL